MKGINLFLGKKETMIRGTFDDNFLFFLFVFVFLRRVKPFIYTQAPLVDNWTAVENDYYYQLTVNCLLH